MFSNRVFKTILRKKEGGIITHDKIVNHYHTNSKNQMYFIMDLPVNTFSIVPLKINFSLPYKCLIESRDYNFIFGYSSSIYNQKIPIHHDQIDLQLTVFEAQSIIEWWEVDSELSIEYEIVNKSNIDKYSLDIVNRNIRSITYQTRILTPKTQIQSIKFFPIKHKTFNQFINLKILAGLEEIEGDFNDEIGKLEDGFKNNFDLNGSNVIFKNIFDDLPNFIKLQISHEDDNYIDLQYDIPFITPTKNIYIKIETNNTPEFEDMDLLNHVMSQSELYRSLYLLIRNDNPKIHEINTSLINEFYIFPRFLHYQIIHKNIPT